MMTVISHCSEFDVTWCRIGVYIPISFWLNTEQHDEINQGQSIIATIDHFAVGILTDNLVHKWSQCAF
jgi:hypothetical protein